MILLVLAALLPTVAACDGATLAGTTWKGANSAGDEVTIEFLDETECMFGALGRATYSVRGDQVTVKTVEHEFVFIRSGDEMKGAGLRMFKQP
jgi:hypothetical protein